jgi:hypothetical protein
MIGGKSVCYEEIIGGQVENEQKYVSVGSSGAARYRLMTCERLKADSQGLKQRNLNAKGDTNDGLWDVAFAGVCGQAPTFSTSQMDALTTSSNMQKLPVQDADAEPRTAPNSWGSTALPSVDEIQQLEA